jgi:hypothetical protein
VFTVPAVTEPDLNPTVLETSLLAEMKRDEENSKPRAGSRAMDGPLRNGGSLPVR